MRDIIVLGCGSSLYAGMASCYPLLNHSRVNVKCISSSEFIFHEYEKASENTVVIALSRSGKTKETIEALKKANHKGAISIGLTCNEDSPLINEAFLSEVLRVGPEGVIATKSFSAMVYALNMIFLEMACNFNDEIEKIKKELELLPAAAENILKHEDVIKQIVFGTLLKRKLFIALGVGPLYGIALELALKIIETSQIPALAYPTLEFRHGPISLIDKAEILIHSFVNKSHNFSLKLLDELIEKGASVTLITNDQKVSYQRKLLLPWKWSDVTASPIAVIPAQLIAYYYCIGRGLNPDSPKYILPYVSNF